MPQLSISEAARAAGVDRATLYRHVKAGKLSLTRDEKGRRVVDASELCRVFPPVLQTVAVATAESVDLLQAKLEAAEEKCALLQQQLNAATAREQWMRQQLVELQQRLLPAPKRSWTDRWAEALAKLRMKVDRV
jgi:predicted site-specific integrase-resolvase